MKAKIKNQLQVGDVVALASGVLSADGDPVMNTMTVCALHDRTAVCAYFDHQGICHRVEMPSDALAYRDADGKWARDADA